jgi:hypothetical protein
VESSHSRGEVEYMVELVLIDWFSEVVNEKVKQFDSPGGNT